MRLAPIAFAGHLLVNVLVIPRDRPRGLPDRLPALLVERRQILNVHPVHRENQEVLEKDQRRGRAAVMTARQVLALPQHLEITRVQAGGAVTAEMHIDSSGLNRRRGRGITVHRVAQRLGLLTMKEFLVVPDLAGLGIHADDKKIVALGRGRGQPNLAAQDYRRGPAAIGDFRLPFDVVGFAPAQRQPQHGRVARAGRMSIAPGAAKLRPIGSGRFQAAGPQAGDQN